MRASKGRAVTARWTVSRRNARRERVAHGDDEVRAHEDVDLAEVDLLAVVVVLLPDSGRGYMSKIFNDDWMSSYGFMHTHTETTVGEVLHRKAGDIPALVHTHPTETVRDAIEILHEYSVSQMPVVKAEPPVMAGEVAGSVSERSPPWGLGRSESGTGTR